MKKNIFTVVMIIFMAVFLAIMWNLAQYFLDRGEGLNKKAWEATYIERKLPVPESGPREGYWGRRLGKGTPDNLLVWHDSEAHISGLLEIDSSGRQQYRSKVTGERGQRPHQIVILGGSTAAGAYASSIRSTYFNIIGERLEQVGLPCDIDIVAAGAWKSSQEVAALERYLQENRPDLVVFLNGLNDLTNGATSHHLYGEPFQAAQGVVIDPLYHSHDYDERVFGYLNNMAVARELTATRGVDMLVVLQPSLNERVRRTTIEEKLLVASLVPHASSQALTASYDAIKEVLISPERSGGIRFLDGSRIFERERQTTFADLWHFSDVGHRVLGIVMADEIFRVLKKRFQYLDKAGDTN